ncbi:MAG: elongation factor EF-2 [Candidatus Thalassarchaeaceae archaeon]|jgi:elongation factor 2|nr:elongation factor EF-2 [Euryarchaeota archaeon]MDP7092162.1 elongation factor EF-2 [Candidatus Thalassarchaeaceae archaeon]MDP7256677.1 elongation factor EF-2 [Candidatus Thalassarchaeaceae archaeon]MDP7446617.1 elongation factor EF-2 [Candidatus Thalassarchaeaceae archaeon]MDP7649350.1 elongation factor EF-2 [Candidatus Thalassarchaeaceae archaeon]|tara:strand:- start:2984 stop:5191 length:2208 start_codon:yes stop_codon:yes gene_type:complete
MGRKEDNIKRATEVMHSREHIRNLAIAAHIDHGKTTLSDNLIAGAGMMSEELAGKSRVLDFDDQEAARGITINAASASMVHKVNGQDYLINLIDTPGHVDFGGDVTRAMRAVDGCIILTCAVEGAMPQTETVVRQALKEKVKPVLFINKVDRLINELQVTPEDMQERFMIQISKVNNLIRRFAPEEHKKNWQVSVQDGTVAFGSAFHNWGITVPYMSKSGISFKDIFEHCHNEQQRELAKKAPVHEVLLDMTVEKLPSPMIAQEYRIPNIWQGELESSVGKSMLQCDSGGPLSLMITKIWMDPHAGEVAVGRVYSGTVKQGDAVWAIGSAKSERVQQVSMMVGSDRIQVPEVSAGNIAALTGVRSAAAGVTIAREQDATPFEAIRHYSEPVVTVAIEPKAMKDLPKFIDALRGLAKADASLEVFTNQETGEALLAGMGELHLEITVYRLEEEQGIKVNVSEPIVVYRESISGNNKGRPFEGKSPNRHNRFYVEAEPLSEEVIQALREGHFGDGPVRAKDAKETGNKFAEFGLDKNMMRKIYAINGTTVLVNDTKGIQNLHETRELIIEAFNDVCKKGPIAEEPLTGVLVRLVDAKLHEDAIHRGPAQTIPAVRNAIKGSLIRSNSVMFEPIQKIRIDAPNEWIGGITREVTTRRGIIEDMPVEGGVASVIGKMPVAESFGFSNDIRAATQGRAVWNTENAGYVQVPSDLFHKISGEIRQRKGLKEEIPGESQYTD